MPSTLKIQQENGYFYYAVHFLCRSLKVYIYFVNTNVFFYDLHTINMPRVVDKQSRSKFSFWFLDKFQIYITSSYCLFSKPICIFAISKKMRNHTHVTEKTTWRCDPRCIIHDTLLFWLRTMYLFYRECRGRSVCKYMHSDLCLHTPLLYFSISIKESPPNAISPIEICDSSRQNGPYRNS